MFGVGVDQTGQYLDIEPEKSIANSRHEKSIANCRHVTRPERRDGWQKDEVNYNKEIDIAIEVGRNPRLVMKC